MIGKTIKALILAQPAVTAIAGDRVYANTVPQGVTAPSIVYTQISGVGSMSQGGPAGPGRARYQINATANTYAVAESLGRALVASIDGFRGMVGGTEIGGAFVENVGDVPTLVASPQSQTEFGKRLDLVVWHD